MIDQPRASTLAREAFDHWQAGRHEQSGRLYEVAIPLADPRHYGLPAYYGEYACVLNELGRHDEATMQLEKSLATEFAQGQAEGSAEVIIARYFLAHQLFRFGDKERALEILAPSIIHAPNDWLTRLGEAHILYALGRKVEAKTVAALAIAHAPTQEKAGQLKQNLAEVFGDVGP